MSANKCCQASEAMQQCNCRQQQLCVSRLACLQICSMKNFDVLQNTIIHTAQNISIVNKNSKICLYLVTSQRLPNQINRNNVKYIKNIHSCPKITMNIGILRKLVSLPCFSCLCFGCQSIYQLFQGIKVRKELS